MVSLRRWARRGAALGFCVLVAACADVWGFHDLGADGGSGSSGGSSGSGSGGSSACDSWAVADQPGATACQQCAAGAIGTGGACASAYDAFKSSCGSCPCSAVDACSCYASCGGSCAALLDTYASCLLSACSASCPAGGGSSSGASSGGTSSGSTSSGSVGCSGNGQTGVECLCTTDMANAFGCSPSNLTYKGACCADPAWPSSGRCICQSFVCYADSETPGKTDCFFSASSNAANPVNPTTSATGAYCCAYGNTNTGQPPGPYYQCSCFPDSSFCSGVIADGQGTSVPSCTMDVLPPCGGGLVTDGYTQVSSCR